jgi:TRAP-type transport system periplasmic protein
MVKFFGVLLASFCLFFSFCFNSAFAETAHLNFASPGAPRSSMHTDLFEPWLEKVVADSEGTLNIRTFYASPLGSYRNMYDRVLNGVVHIAFTTVAPIGGKFLQTDVASLPFETQSALQGSVALWNLYENGTITKEFEDIKLLGIFMFPNSALHMKGDRAIERLEDFQGAKIRTAGKMQSDTLVLLGGSPVTAGPSEIYQGLNRGVYDGAIIPWTGVSPFKLDEVTQFHMNAPLGSSVAMIFMNKETFDTLPASAQRAIESNSGMSLTRTAAGHSDTDAAKIEQAISRKEGQVIREIDPDEAARWRRELQPLIDEWVANTPNGAAVLAAFREQVEQFNADTVFEQVSEQLPEQIAE